MMLLYKDNTAEEAGDNWNKQESKDMIIDYFGFFLS